MLDCVETTAISSLPSYNGGIVLSFFDGNSKLQDLRREFWGSIYRPDMAERRKVVFRKLRPAADLVADLTSSPEAKAFAENSLRRIADFDKLYDRGVYNPYDIRMNAMAVEAFNSLETALQLEGVGKQRRRPRPNHRRRSPSNP